MFEGKNISVVVPAYNEANLIEQTLASIPDYVDHICVVDDASVDATVKKVSGYADSRLLLISHAMNQGVGAAIITGYRESIRWGADVVAVMAGDAQMDPTDLENVILPVVRDIADYCKGDRLSWKGVHRVMPLLRFLGNHALSLITRLACGYQDIRDSQCGYTAISGQILRKLNLSRIYTRYGFPNDLLAHLYTVQARLAQVTVRPVYGAEKSGISLYTAFFRVPRVLLRAFVYRLRHRPSRLDKVASTSVERA